MMSTPQSPVIDVMMTGTPAGPCDPRDVVLELRARHRGGDVLAGSGVLTPTIAPRTKRGVAARITGASAARTRHHAGVAPRIHAAVPTATAAIRCHFSATRRMVGRYTDTGDQPRRVSARAHDSVQTSTVR